MMCSRLHNEISDISNLKGRNREIAALQVLWTQRALNSGPGSGHGVERTFESIEHVINLF